MVQCVCDKRACFGLIDDKRPSCCYDCKTDNMVNIISKKCKCKKHITIYGLIGDNKATCCYDCKTSDMIDIVHKRCMCDKIPVYGLFGDKKATCCYDCKTDNMINIVHKRCMCDKIPVYGLIGDKKATHCFDCKTDNMINIVNKRCKSIHCDTSGNKKYDGYCIHCFKHLFPNDPRTPLIRFKTKELYVKEYLSENHNGFIHDTTLETEHCDCSHRRKIDFRMLINNTMLCIEVDEGQHSSYAKDDIRYDDLMMTFTGKFIFIRFNPDNYRINGVLKKTQIRTRLNKLSNEIVKQQSRIDNEENNDMLEIIKLYYNE